MTACILVVDDKASLRQLINEYLSQEGFKVLEARDGTAALPLAQESKPDLIVLDLMMPDMGGYEFLRLHRQTANTPIIILTARLEENDRVIGLELGADDYITKPFSMRELVARIRAVLRRAHKHAENTTVVEIDDLKLDRDQYTVQVGESYIDLTPTEFNLLAALMAQPGRTYSRLELWESSQDGIAFDGVERTIDTHIHNVRTKIDLDPHQPSHIESVYGVGYRLSLKR